LFDSSRRAGLSGTKRPDYIPWIVYICENW
jgi:hypothetical protein